MRDDDLDNEREDEPAHTNGEASDPRDLLINDDILLDDDGNEIPQEPGEQI